ncbi:MAG: GntR family transcriptional regulator [Planctomycetota bacterium]
MFFRIDPDDELPIYEQLVRQVKLAIADGVLVGGQLVPSVRQLAAKLAINPNTIARAYTQLQTDRVLQPLRGRGLVVRRDALARCTKARNRMVLDRIRRVVTEALRGGLSQAEIQDAFQAELARQVDQADRSPSPSSAAPSAGQQNGES